MVTFDEVRSLPQTVSLHVTPELCDVNGHLTVRHQVGIHDDAAWGLLDSLGMGLEHVADGASYFDMEQHVSYFSEALSGELVAVHHRLLDVSSGSLHFMSHLAHAEQGAVISTFECLLLAIDLQTRSVRRFPSEELQRLVVRTRQDRMLDWDAGACSAMGVRRSALAD